jgi:selenocysteine lyase/cysteine desulfurase
MTAAIDVSRARLHTPACERVIHFNNAGASLMPNPVYRAVVDHLELERAIGGYEAEAQSKNSLEDFYDAFASLLGCGRDEIAYVENATRAWDMIFYALPLREGDRVLTHESEYASNYLAFLHLARRRGIGIDVAPSDGMGQVDVEAMARMVGSRTKLVAITHVPTQGGLVNPAEAVGVVAREHGLFYLLDACQSVGQMPINVTAIGCDMLSGTGRKFLRGPRGTGFLYVRRGLLRELEPPFIDLHAATWIARDVYELRDDARRFENWESFVAGRIGLQTAVRYALDLGLDAIAVRVTLLARRLRETLAALPGITVHDRGARQCAIVTFTKDGEEPDALAGRLRAAGANISVSTATSAQLDLGPRGLPAIARASVHYYNTEGEIDRFCKLVGKSTAPAV